MAAAAAARRKRSNSCRGEAMHDEMRGAGTLPFNQNNNTNNIDPHTNSGNNTPSSDNGNASINFMLTVKPEAAAAATAAAAAGEAGFSLRLSPTARVLSPNSLTPNSGKSSPSSGMFAAVVVAGMSIQSLSISPPTLLVPLPAYMPLSPSTQDVMAATTHTDTTTPTSPPAARPRSIAMPGRRGSVLPEGLQSPAKKEAINDAVVRLCETLPHKDLPTASEIADFRGLVSVYLSDDLEQADRFCSTEAFRPIRAELLNVATRLHLHFQQQEKSKSGTFTVADFALKSMVDDVVSKLIFSV